MASPANPRYSWVSADDAELEDTLHGDFADGTRAEAVPVSPVSENANSVRYPDAVSAAQHASEPNQHRKVSGQSDSDFDAQAPTPRETDQFALPDVQAFAYWSPFSLRRAVLFVFIVLLLIFVVALAILFGLSFRDGHLAAVNPDQYYLWTYGPIAGRNACPGTFVLS